MAPNLYSTALCAFKMGEEETALHLLNRALLEYCRGQPQKLTTTTTTTPSSPLPSRIDEETPFSACSSSFSLSSYMKYSTDKGVIRPCRVTHAQVCLLLALRAKVFTVLEMYEEAIKDIFLLSRWNAPEEEREEGGEEERVVIKEEEEKAEAASVPTTTLSDIASSLVMGFNPSAPLPVWGGANNSNRTGMVVAPSKHEKSSSSSCSSSASHSQASGAGGGGGAMGTKPSSSSSSTTTAVQCLMISPEQRQEVLRHITDALKNFPPYFSMTTATTQSGPGAAPATVSSSSSACFSSCQRIGSFCYGVANGHPLYLLKAICEAEISKVITTVPLLEQQWNACVRVRDYAAASRVGVTLLRLTGNVKYRLWNIQMMVAQLPPLSCSSTATIDALCASLFSFSSFFSSSSTVSSFLLRAPEEEEGCKSSSPNGEDERGGETGTETDFSLRLASAMLEQVLLQVPMGHQEELISLLLSSPSSSSSSPVEKTGNTPTSSSSSSLPSAPMTNGASDGNHHPHHRGNSNHIGNRNTTATTTSLSSSFSSSDAPVTSGATPSLASLYVEILLRRTLEAVSESDVEECESKVIHFIASPRGWLLGSPRRRLEVLAKTLLFLSTCGEKRRRWVRRTQNCPSPSTEEDENITNIEENEQQKQKQKKKKAEEEEEENKKRCQLEINTRFAALANAIAKELWSREEVDNWGYFELYIASLERLKVLKARWASSPSLSLSPSSLPPPSSLLPPQKERTEVEEEFVPHSNPRPPTKEKAQHGSEGKEQEQEGEQEEEEGGVEKEVEGEEKNKKKRRRRRKAKGKNEEDGGSEEENPVNNKKINNNNNNNNNSNAPKSHEDGVDAVVVGEGRGRRKRGAASAASATTAAVDAICPATLVVEAIEKVDSWASSPSQQPQQNINTKQKKKKEAEVPLEAKKTVSSASNPLFPSRVFSIRDADDSLEIALALARTLQEDELRARGLPPPPSSSSSCSFLPPGTVGLESPQERMEEKKKEYDNKGEGSEERMTNPMMNKSKNHKKKEKNRMNPTHSTTATATSTTRGDTESTPLNGGQNDAKSRGQSLRRGAFLAELVLLHRSLLSLSSSCGSCSRSCSCLKKALDDSSVHEEEKRKRLEDTRGGGEEREAEQEIVTSSRPQEQEQPPSPHYYPRFRHLSRLLDEKVLTYATYFYAQPSCFLDLSPFLTRSSASSIYQWGITFPAASSFAEENHLHPHNSEKHTIREEKRLAKRNLDDHLRAILGIMCNIAMWGVKSQYDDDDEEEKMNLPPPPPPPPPSHTPTQEEKKEGEEGKQKDAWASLLPLSFSSPPSLSVMEQMVDACLREHHQSCADIFSSSSTSPTRALPWSVEGPTDGFLLCAANVALAACFFFHSFCTHGGSGGRRTPAPPPSAAAAAARACGDDEKEEKQNSLSRQEEEEEGRRRNARVRALVIRVLSALHQAPRGERHPGLLLFRIGLTSSVLRLQDVQALQLLRLKSVQHDTMAHVGFWSTLPSLPLLPWTPWKDGSNSSSGVGGGGAGGSAVSLFSPSRNYSLQQIPLSIREAQPIWRKRSIGGGKRRGNILLDWCEAASFFYTSSGRQTDDARCRAVEYFNLPVIRSMESFSARGHHSIYRYLFPRLCRTLVYLSMCETKEEVLSCAEWNREGLRSVLQGMIHQHTHPASAPLLQTQEDNHEDKEEKERTKRRRAVTTTTAVPPRLPSLLDQTDWTAMAGIVLAPAGTPKSQTFTRTLFSASPPSLCSIYYSHWGAPLLYSLLLLCDLGRIHEMEEEKRRSMKMARENPLAATRGEDSSHRGAGAFHQKWLFLTPFASFSSSRHLPHPHSVTTVKTTSTPNKVGDRDAVAGRVPHSPHHHSFSTSSSSSSSCPVYLPALSHGVAPLLLLWISQGLHMEEKEEEKDGNTTIASPTLPLTTTASSSHPAAAAFVFSAAKAGAVSNESRSAAIEAFKKYCQGFFTLEIFQRKGKQPPPQPTRRVEEGKQEKEEEEKIIHHHHHHSIFSWSTSGVARFEEFLFPSVVVLLHIFRLCKTWEKVSSPMTTTGAPPPPPPSSSETTADTTAEANTFCDASTSVLVNNFPVTEWANILAETLIQAKKCYMNNEWSDGEDSLWFTERDLGLSITSDHNSATTTNDKNNIHHHHHHSDEKNHNNIGGYRLLQLSENKKSSLMKFLDKRIEEAQSMGHE